jgi:IclR family transcriptional regulator, acetate operon repressor
MTADEMPAADETGKIRGAETARRTVRVLAALAARQPIGLDELSQVVGLNKNTTYRLLRVLQEEGYSERLPQGGYRLGPAAAALSSGSPLSASGPQAARPSMQELAEITGETVTLHRLAGDRAVVWAGVESEQHALRRVTRVGESYSLLAGCAENVILAFLDAPHREGVLDRGGLAPPARRALERYLDEVADQGYATSRGANHPGLFGIAAPVPRAGGGAAGLSVSVSGPEGRWTREAAVSHVGALLRCCGRVSVLLPTRR